MTEKHLINHVAMVLDGSGSMSNLEKKVIQVFDGRISYMRESSVRWNQETRVSVYVFDSRIECVVFDMDVTRVNSSMYKVYGGMTALNDALALSFNDSKLLPQKYGDHAFTGYILTDGIENASKLKNVTSLFNEADKLGNYSWSVLVPGEAAKKSCIQLGYPENIIETWDVSEKGLEQSQVQFNNAMENYYKSRSMGLKSVGSFIKADLSGLNKANVVSTLSKLPTSKYIILANPSNKAVYTSVLCQDNNIPYVNGNCYYELVKTETVQPYKAVAIQSRKDDSVYTGAEARKILNLPNYETTIKVGDHGDWNIFIQSTAPNRNIIPKQRMLVIK